VEVLFDCWQREGTVFTAGNGGSASTATHLACDLAKATIIPKRRRLKTMCLVDNVPLASAWTNDSGFASLFAEQLEPWLTERDVLVALSVHGGSGEGEAGPWSQNLPAAVALARHRGARVIGLSGFGGGHLARSADVCVVPSIRSRSARPWSSPGTWRCTAALHGPAPAIEKRGEGRCRWNILDTANLGRSRLVDWVS
jgi:D-sedoheptulose 7-phosphate isomerase